MKKNGFTLVELLAVIAVLGLIIIIAIPNINESVRSSKEKAFFTSAKSILRTIEYDNVDGLVSTPMNLSQFDLQNLSTTDYDLENSIVYTINNTIYMNLVGKGKFSGYYLCSVTSSTKNYSIQNENCPEVD